MCFVGNWVEVDEKQIWFIDFFRLDQWNGHPELLKKKTDFLGCQFTDSESPAAPADLMEEVTAAALGWWVFLDDFWKHFERHLPGCARRSVGWRRWTLHPGEGNFLQLLPLVSHGKIPWSKRGTARTPRIELCRFEGSLWREDLGLVGRFFLVKRCSGKLSPWIPSKKTTCFNSWSEVSSSYIKSYDLKPQGLEQWGLKGGPGEASCCTPGLPGGVLPKPRVFPMWTLRWLLWLHGRKKGKPWAHRPNREATVPRFDGGNFLDAKLASSYTVRSDPSPGERITQVRKWWIDWLKQRPFFVQVWEALATNSGQDLRQVVQASGVWGWKMGKKSPLTCGI